MLSTLLMLSAAASTSGTDICSTMRHLWERGELSTIALDELMRLEPCHNNGSTSFSRDDRSPSSPSSSSRRSLESWGFKPDPTNAWAFKLLGARVAELDREWLQMQAMTLANFNPTQYKMAFQALWLGLTRTLFRARVLPVDSAGGKHRNHRFTIARYYIDKALRAPEVKALGDGKVCAEVGDKHFLRAYFPTCAEMLAVDLKDPKADVLVDLVHPDWTDPRIKQAHFDLLVVGEVMEHIDRVDVALATLVRLLKPGGTIVWTTPFLMQYHANPGDENRYSPTRVNALFDRAGLDTVKSDGVGNWLAVTLYLAGFGTDETHSSELDAPDRDGSRPYWIDVIAVGRKRTSSLDSRAMPTAETPALSLEAALRRVQPGSNRRAWKSMVAPAKLQHLYESVLHNISVAEHPVDGAFVECGVWRGGATMMMLYAEFAALFRDGSRPHRDVWLFDTFEGMPVPGKRDGSRAARRWDNVQASIANNSAARERTAGWSAEDMATGGDGGEYVDTSGQVRWNYGPIDIVRKNIESTTYPSERVRYIKGKVEDTLTSPGQVLPQKIALLRLDTDWYKSVHESSFRRLRCAPRQYVYCRTPAQPTRSHC